MMLSGVTVAGMSPIRCPLCGNSTSKSITCLMPDAIVKEYKSTLHIQVWLGTNAIKLCVCTGVHNEALVMQ